MKRSLLKRVIRAAGKKAFLSSGFTDLDDKITGFQKRKVYLIAGEYKNGKTVFVQSLTLNMAQNGIKVVHCGVSRGDEEVTRDFLTMTGGELEKLKALKILVNDLICPDLTKLLDCMLRYDSYLLADVLVIDGLEYLSTTKSYLSRADEYDSMIRELKEAAGYLDIPIIVTVDLPVERNDYDEYRTDHKPLLSDLRKLGRMDKLADTVILLYRDDAYKINSDKKGIMELYVVRTDLGYRGIVNVAFERNTLRCLPLKKTEQEEV